MKLRDILLSIERDEYIEPSHLTVGDWLEEWFRIYCLPHKKASTCTGYEEEIYLHLKPYIGRVPLQELKAQHVQAAINELVKEDKVSATARKAHTILHAALEQAVINQMLLRNPSEHTMLTFDFSRLSGTNCGMNCGTSRKGYPLLQALQAKTCGFCAIQRKRTCISASPAWSIT